MAAYLVRSSSSHSLASIAVIVALIVALTALVVGLINSGVQRKLTELIMSEQIMDRFMKAVEQLASESAEVRIGAIFALEQIAGESLHARSRIVAILSVLVRNRLPDSRVRDGEYVQSPLRRAPDAQAALTALCRRPLSDDRPLAEGGGLNLTHTDLRRADLVGADLRRANLRHAHLEGADLREANLQDANLAFANLDSFMPSNQNFQRGADLRKTNLCGAQLKDSRNLSIALIEDAVADDLTTWPDGFDWRAAGVKLAADAAPASISAKRTTSFSIARIWQR